MDAPDQVEEVAVIDNTNWERLVAKAVKDQEELSASKLNMERRRQIIKEIASVFYFLKREIDWTQDTLSLEEFETAQAELKMRAKEKIEDWLGVFGGRRGWKYYLKFGYFHFRRAPLRHGRKWYSAHGWYQNSYQNFHPDEFLASTKNWSPIPENIVSLFSEIFEKRFNQKD